MECANLFALWPGGTKFPGLVSLQWICLQIHSMIELVKGAMLQKPYKYEVARGAALLGILASLLLPVFWLSPKIIEPVSGSWTYLLLVPAVLGFSIAVWKLTLIVKDPAVNILTCSVPLVPFYLLIQVDVTLSSVAFVVQSFLIAIWIFWIIKLHFRDILTSNQR